jgi:hypothetical protein
VDFSQLTDEEFREYCASRGSYIHLIDGRLKIERPWPEAFAELKRRATGIMRLFPGGATFCTAEPERTGD